MTAASGGNREELLGPWPAASGSEADAGSRNPGSVTEGDGEGKPGKIELLCSDKQTFCQSEPSPRSKFFISVLALSGASRQLSQRESLLR